MHRSFHPLGCGVLFLALGCGDGGTAPDPGGDARRLAAQFERLADSAASGGYTPAAEALRHAAQVVRLAGGATPVTLTIDGTARGFLAVAEQIDYPNLYCSWPGDSGSSVPPDSGVASEPGGASMPEPWGGCTVADTTSMRTLIAWEPDRLAEVVRIVADVGGASVKPTTPDVMVGLPESAPPDSAVSGGGGGAGYPGFMGEYLVRDVGSWYAVEGEQSNSLADQRGDCTADRTTFDWAEFSCRAAAFQFELSMRVEPLRNEPLVQWIPGAEPAWPGGEGSHQIALARSTVSGVRLTVIAWTPPPLPPEPGEPPPIPADSSVVHPAYP